MAEESDVEANDDGTKVDAKRKTIYLILKILFHVLLLVYFIYATYHYIDVSNSNACKKQPTPVTVTDDSNATENTTPTSTTLPVLCQIEFCNGYGMLMLLIIFLYLGLLYYRILKPKVGEKVYNNCLKPGNDWWMEFSRTRIVTLIEFAVIGTIIVIFLFFEVKDDFRKMAALVGPIFYLVAGYTFSTKRSAIKWRVVLNGLLFQFILGFLCMRWAVGRSIFHCIGQKVAEFLGFTEKGARFVFGDDIVDNHVFAFPILSVIFFFSFTISTLYYLGIMQWVILTLGWILQVIIGTTVCESVNAAGNIFLGQTESPLLIRPYIAQLTASEIHTVMVSGFATIAGTVLAAYLSFGATAAHLIASSVMAAPASLAISKLYMPETEESQTTADNIQLLKSPDSSALDAASSGASNAIPLVLGIVANIVAFIAALAFLNALVRCLGVLVGLSDLDFEFIFSKLFIPLVWAMGIPPNDCDVVARVVASKTMINEFIAFQQLGAYYDDGRLSARSKGIATFAICGFANPGSIGILMGGLTAMAPARKAVISAVVFRAFVVGSIVCFTSASYAGIFMGDEVY